MHARCLLLANIPLTLSLSTTRSLYSYGTGTLIDTCCCSGQISTEALTATRQVHLYTLSACHTGSRLLQQQQQQLLTPAGWQVLRVTC